MQSQQQVAQFLSAAGSFPTIFRGQKIHASDVAARPIEAGYQTQPNWVVDSREDDRNRRSRVFGRERRRWATRREEHCHSEIGELSRECRQLVVAAFRPAKSYRQIMALHKSCFA
jgi:hypothetical protein